MSTIRIFIASSKELSQDRKDFREFLSFKNDRLHKKEIYFELVEWEYFLDSVSLTPLQGEYNKQIENSSIIVCLYFTKAGKYTREEFDTALKHFKDYGTPLIYIYFKTGASEWVSDDLVNFKNRLEEIGHFYASYDSSLDLKDKFAFQLDILEEKGFIVMRDEIRNKAEFSVNNYFASHNSAITHGNHNITIQGVTDSSIIVNVNSETQEDEILLTRSIEDVRNEFMSIIKEGEYILKQVEQNPPMIQNNPAKMLEYWDKLWHDWRRKIDNRFRQSFNTRKLERDLRNYKVNHTDLDMTLKERSEALPLDIEKEIEYLKIVISRLENYIK